MKNQRPLRQKSFTHIDLHASSGGRESLVHLIPVLVPEYLLRLSRFQAPLLLIHLRDGRVGVYTAPNYSTKPIRYVTHHFRDRHRIRNGFYPRKKKRLLRDFCSLILSENLRNGCFLCIHAT